MGLPIEPNDRRDESRTIRFRQATLGLNFLCAFALGGCNTAPDQDWSVFPGGDRHRTAASGGGGSFPDFQQIALNEEIKRNLQEIERDHEASIETNKRVIATLEAKLASLDRELLSIKSKVANLEALSDLKALQNRLGAMERNIDALNRRIESSQ